MDLFIDNRSQTELFQGYEELIKSVAEEILARFGIEIKIEFTVSIVDDIEIRKINKQFRAIDKATDVLSFPLMEFCDGALNGEPSEDGCIGDIIISAQRALAQSKQYGHSLQRELGFLTAHGMLHLLGFDHMSHSEEEKMFLIQEDIMGKLELRR